MGSVVVGTLEGLIVSVTAGCAVGSAVATVEAAVVTLDTEVWLGAVVDIAAGDPQAARTLKAKIPKPIVKTLRRNTLCSIIFLTSISPTVLNINNDIIRVGCLPYKGQAQQYAGESTMRS
jgi:hypothetical protein